MEKNFKPRPFDIEIENQVLKEQNYVCVNCGNPLNRIDRPDHIVPQTKTNVKVYGEKLIYSKENCQIPCLRCHQNKNLWSKPKIKALIEKWRPFSKSKMKK